MMKVEFGESWRYPRDTAPRKPEDPAPGGVLVGMPSCHIFAERARFK